MKHYVVSFTKKAETVFGDIYTFIAKDRPTAAQKYVLQLKEACLSLERLPLRGRQIENNGRYEYTGDIRCLTYRPYRIIYTIVGHEVIILDVCHSARAT